MKSVAELIDILRASNDHLKAVANGLEFSWAPGDLTDGRRLHNKYARNLFAAYVSKESDLVESMLSAIAAKHYLTYALCARALIETVATLRWYIETQYRPILDSKTGDIGELIQIDDQHLRGGRFAWEDFLNGNYETMAEQAAQALKDKKSKKSQTSARTQSNPMQVNVATCIDHWSTSQPFVKVTYDLFCELVHPNTGSNFMVAGEMGHEMWFNPKAGKTIAHRIFEKSFPLLCAVLREHPRNLTLLLASMFQDDELKPN